MKKNNKYLKTLFKILFQLETTINLLDKNEDSHDYERCESCHQFKDVKIIIEEQQNFKLIIESLIDEYLKSDK